MYRCSNCGVTMSQPLDRCPSCHVLLAGVKCQSCGYLGGKTEFVNNNNRCPKCGSPVRSVGGAQEAPKCPKCGNVWDQLVCETCGHKHWSWIIGLVIMSTLVTFLFIYTIRTSESVIGWESAIGCLMGPVFLLFSVYLILKKPMKQKRKQKVQQDVQQIEKQETAHEIPLQYGEHHNHLSRIVLICSKAETGAPNFQAPLKKIVNTYQSHKNVPSDAIKFFISPSITLPDINNQMACNMFIFTGLMANKINKPENMSWNGDLYKEGGYDFIVFDIKLS